MSSKNANATTQQYAVSQLRNSFINGEPNASKYFLSTCQRRVNDALDLGKHVDWLTIEKSLKMTYSVLKAILQQNGAVIVKLGGRAVKREYEVGELLKTQRGFLKFICHFACNDDYLEHSGATPNKTLCKSRGDSMHAIVMPYMDAGSVGDHAWTLQNVEVLRSLMKQSVLFVLSAWEKSKFLHGDLHVKNILIKPTTYEKVHVTLFGQTISVPTHEFTPLVMDFENSEFVTARDLAFGTQRFFMDLAKLFATMSTFIKNIDVTTVFKVSQRINNTAVNLGDASELLGLIPLVDGLSVLDQV